MATGVVEHDTHGPGGRPHVEPQPPAIACAFVAGCDGDHGISRATVPEGVLTAHSFDHGIGWLTVLADALEEAGCTNADILLHLRSPGPHVRGCWALDLILGKS